MGFFLLILALLYATKRRNPTPEKVHLIDNVAYAVSTEWILCSLLKDLR